MTDINKASKKRSASRVYFDVGEYRDIITPSSYQAYTFTEFFFKGQHFFFLCKYLIQKFYIYFIKK